MANSVKKLKTQSLFDDIDANDLESLIWQYYPNGFRWESNIELERFAGIYKKKYGHTISDFECNRQKLTR
jgi:hypothetical protein